MIRERADKGGKKSHQRCPQERLREVRVTDGSTK